MNIEKSLWGKTGDGKEIYRFRLANSSGASVILSNIGAAIVSAYVPDREGRLEDVVLGYPDSGDYFGDGPCAGKVPGRYANRIAKGRFTLDGKEYVLPVNNGPNHLHGGPEGFQNQVWDYREKDGGLEFMYFSEDGEMGYPGAVKAVARYEWSDDNELTLILTAETDAPTIVNLTNHAYFNLNGQGKGNILSHELWLNASEYLPTDDTLIPLGPSESVAGTPMDFTVAKPLGRDINEDFPALKYGKGYDSCWVIDGSGEESVRLAAELYAPESGRTLQVYTTQPGVQVYTGNWLSGCPKGKDGSIYEDYDGVAVECQRFPDSPNEPDYPSAVVRPGTPYREAIIFSFGVRK